MTDKDEALSLEQTLRLALEYVELVPDDRYNAEHIDQDALITAIKAALLSRSDGEAKDEPIQEPAAWISKHNVVYPLDAWNEVHPINELKPLYTNPPQRKPLTDEEIENAIDAWFKPNSDGTYGTWHERMRAAIKAAHGITGDNT
jgi:hypothetical protein